MAGINKLVVISADRLPMKKAFRLITILSILTSCGDKDKSILNNRDFDNGDWFVVIRNYETKNLFVIDDENILKENPFGLLLGPGAECGGTTCDGFIMLYKDGKLIEEQEYLTKSDLIESADIKKAYKKATDDSVHPYDQTDFNRQWDSLKKLKNVYPTIYHTQPDDKDIIWFYKYE
jgi:hypothetical protein